MLPGFEQFLLEIEKVARMQQGNRVNVSPLCERERERERLSLRATLRACSRDERMQRHSKNGRGMRGF